MALYRAKSMGLHPDGSAKRVREGCEVEWDFGGDRAPQWLELAEAQASPAPTEAPEEANDDESETAPAETKRKLRNRSPKGD